MGVAIVDVAAVVVVVVVVVVVLVLLRSDDRSCRRSTHSRGRIEDVVHGGSFQSAVMRSCVFLGEEHEKSATVTQRQGA